MNGYIVSVKDLDGLKHTILCKDYDDLNNFLNHIDKDEYTPIGLDLVENFNSNFKEFCKSDKKLETGKET